MNLKYVKPRRVKSSPPAQIHSHVFPIFLHFYQISKALGMKQLLRIFSLQTKHSGHKVQFIPLLPLLLLKTCFARALPVYRRHTVHKNLFFSGESCAAQMGLQAKLSLVMVVIS